MGQPRNGGLVPPDRAAAALADDRGLPAIELRLGRVHARRGDLATAASHLDAAIEALDGDRAAGREQAATLEHALVERALVAVGIGDLDLADACAARKRMPSPLFAPLSITGWPT